MYKGYEKLMNKCKTKKPKKPKKCENCLYYSDEWEGLGECYLTEHIMKAEDCCPKYQEKSNG